MSSQKRLVTIDEKLFAHINTDPFLKGSVGLEGNRFTTTIGYLNQYINSLPKQHVSEDVKQLQTLCNGLLTTEQAIDAINLNPSHARTKQLADELFDEIEALSPEETRLMPGGWLGSAGGHAIIYQWHRDADGNLLFSLQNSGDGLQFHERRSDTDKELYNPMLTYRIPEEHSHNRQALSIIIQQLIELNISRLHKKGGIKADALYKDILSQFSHVNGETILNRDITEDSWYTAGQLSGTCSQHSLHQMLKARFSSRDSYRQFIYGFKSHSVDDYYDSLVSTGRIDDIKYLPQLEKAIRHNIRLLQSIKTDGSDEYLFSKSYRESELAKFSAYLTHIRRVKKEARVPVASFPSISSFSPEKNIVLNLPSTTSVTDRQRNHRTAVLVENILRFEGGDDILTNLQSLLVECKRLDAHSLEEQHQLLKQLEHIFFSLPLPDSFSAPLLPFYSGIDSEAKSLAFYQKINELQRLYFSCCDQIVGREKSTPNMYLAKISLNAVMGHINHQFPLSKNRQAFHLNFATHLIHGVTPGSSDSAFLANEDPYLDERVLQLKRLYREAERFNKSSFDSDFYQYYDQILQQEPELKIQLENFYQAKYGKLEDKLHTKLANKGMRALFYFFENWQRADFDKVQFKPLIDKFMVQRQLEISLADQTGRLVDKTTYSGDRDKQFKLELRADSLSTQNYFLGSEKALVINDMLTDTKYAHASNKIKAVLQRDNTIYSFHEYSKRSDNHTQLVPGKYARKELSSGFYSDGLESEEMSELSRQNITLDSLEERELFHLRASANLQIDLTLDYFTTNIHKLKDDSLQIYLNANIFQPGLLLDKLQSKDFETFISKFNGFITCGLNFYKKTSGHTATSLSLFRLKYKVLQYAVAYDSEQHLAKLEAYVDELKQAIISTDNKIIKQSLHPILFQSLSTISRHRSLSIDELHLLMQTCFFYNLQSEDQSHFDTDEKLKYEKQKHHYIKTIRQQTSKIQKEYLQVVLQSLDIPLPKSDIIVEGRYPNYDIRSLSGEVLYNVDVENAVVYKGSWAFTALPLAIINHPAINNIGLKDCQNGFVSPDNRTYLIEQPPIKVRIIKFSTYYKIQKEFVTKTGHKEYFELVCHSEEHQNKYKQASFAQGSLSKILKEREKLFWKKVSGNEILVTDCGTNAVEFYGQETGHRIQLEDAAGKGTLLSNNHFRHTRIAQFENFDFINIYQKNKTELLIELPRYNLSFTANIETNQVIFKIRGKEYILDESASPLSSLPSLTFRAGEDSFCVLPMQSLLLSEERSRSSEYHKLELDTENQANKKRTKKFEEKFWQYSDSEQYLICKLENEAPLPQTTKDALYLAYLYLGEGHYEKAWQTLQKCDQTLGGLSGSHDELTILYKIIKELPFKMTDDTPDIQNPSIVACQLKALSLITDYLSQDKRFKVPEPVKNPNNINEELQRIQADEISGFVNSLEGNIYSLYSRYQKMHREALVDLQLSDDDSFSLLNYYHRTTKSTATSKAKPLGALGYAWVKLCLNQVKKERHALSSKRVKSTFDLQRIQEIDDYIEKHEGVAKVTSTLEHVAINTALPNAWDIDTSVLSSSNQEKVVGYRDPLKNIHQHAHKQADAINRLAPKLSEDSFIEIFPALLSIANDPSNKHRDALSHYCYAELIANRHYNMGVKGNKQILCNLLYRFLKSNRPLPSGSYSYQNVTDYNDLFRHAKGLPNPVVKITQLKDDTSEILRTADEVLHDLPEDSSKESVPVLSETTSYIAEQQIFSEDFLDTFSRTAEYWRSIEMVFLEGEQAEEEIESKDTAETLDTSKKFLSSDELHSGESKYLANGQLAELALSTFTEPALDKIAKELDDSHTTISEQKEALEQQIFDLLKTAPADDLLKQQRKLQEASAVRNPITIEKLLSLYFQNDVEKYLVETDLSREQVKSLHKLITMYVQHSLQLQQIDRSKSALFKVKSTTGIEARQNKIKLGKALFASNIIDPAADPELSIYQLYEDILIRPIQKKAIDRLLTQPGEEGFAESIERIIMGGGKSKVILPTTAFKKATGTNLTIVAVPQTLLNTNYIDLKSTSSRLFNQKAILFEFNRSSNCSSARLKEIYDQFCNAMINKSYLVTTGESLQSIELKYLELLSSPPELFGLSETEQAEALAEWQEQVKWANKIILLFKEKGDLIIDEVHHGLLLKNKLNYTIGDSSKIDLSTIKNTILLYQFLDKITITADDGHEILFSELVAKNQLINAPDKLNDAFDVLSHQLLHHEHSPLAKIAKSFDDHQLELLNEYLHDRGDNVPDFVEALEPEQKSKLALFKEQVSHLLPHTLKRNHKEHYGPSKDASHAPDLQMLSIPYIANNTPNERSRFGNALETANFSIQSLLISGISKPLLRKYLESLMAQARYELIENGLTDISETPSALQFSAIIGNSLFSLANIDLEDEEQFEAIHHFAAKNKLLGYDILEKQILRNIKFDPKILHSDAYNYVDLVRSCQGMSGTPSNHSTYHKRLKFELKSSQGVDGLVYQALKHNTDHVWHYDFTDASTTINALFDRYDDSAQLRSIIDVNATFKGISNEEVAHEIARYLIEHPSKFQTNNTIKYILYFNSENKITALPLENFPDGDPIVIGSSDVDVINSRLGCGPNERFTLYDQAHTVGADIKQSYDARALVMLDDKTKLSSCFQGSMRMRGLIEEAQRLDIVVPTRLKDTTVDDLCQMMFDHEQSSLQDDNFNAACAQLKNTIRNQAIKRILNTPDVAIKQQILEAFESSFFEIQQQDLFKKYGQISKFEKTSVILHSLKQELTTRYQSQLDLIGLEPLEGEFATIEEKLNAIVAEACKPGVCKERQIVNDTNTEDTVEIQKEVQIEVEVEKELQNQMFDPYLIPTEYISWHKSSSKSTLGIRSLSSIAASGGGVEPGFSPNIKASRNFYQTYERQENYLNMFLKPVHSLMFEYTSTGTLTCHILSQQEADELSQDSDYLAFHNAWLTTTQFTTLAGTPPVGIRDNVEYQTLIEQVRYFNGEFSSLLSGDLPLDWLMENSKQKLSFFEKYLYNNHETLPIHLAHLRSRLFNHVGIYKYITSNLELDGESVDWMSRYPDIEEDTIEGLKALCLVCNKLSQEWMTLDLSNSSWYQSYGIPLASLGFLQPVILQYQALKEILLTLEKKPIEAAYEELIAHSQKAHNLFPQIDLSDKEDNLEYHLTLQVLAVYNLKKYPSHSPLFQLLLKFPSLSVKNLQALNEAANAEGKSIFNYFNDPTLEISQRMITAMVSFNQSSQTLTELANHQNLAEDTFIDIFEHSKLLHCADHIKSILFSKPQMPIDCLTHLLSDKELSFTTTELLTAAVRYVDYDLVSTKLTPEHVGSPHFEPKAFSNSTKVARSTIATKIQLIKLLLSEELCLALSHSTESIELTRAIAQTTSSAECLRNIINTIDVTDDESWQIILNKQGLDDELVLEIAKKFTSEMIVKKLLSMDLSNQDDVYQYILKNSNVHEEQYLVSIAGKTGDSRILTLLMEHPYFVESDPLLKEILLNSSAVEIIDQIQKLHVSKSVKSELINHRSTSSIMLAYCLLPAGELTDAQHIKIINHPNCTIDIIKTIAEQTTSALTLETIATEVEDENLDPELCDILLQNSTFSSEMLHTLCQRKLHPQAFVRLTNSSAPQQETLVDLETATNIISHDSEQIIDDETLNVCTERYLNSDVQNAILKHNNATVTTYRQVAAHVQRDIVIDSLLSNTDLCDSQVYSSILASTHLQSRHVYEIAELTTDNDIFQEILDLEDEDYYISLLERAEFTATEQLTQIATYSRRPYSFITLIDSKETDLETQQALLENPDFLHSREAIRTLATSTTYSSIIAVIIKENFESLGDDEINAIITNFANQPAILNALIPKIYSPALLENFARINCTDEMFESLVFNPATDKQTLQDCYQNNALSRVAIQSIAKKLSSCELMDKVFPVLDKSSPQLQVTLLENSYISETQILELIKLATTTAVQQHLIESDLIEDHLLYQTLLQAHAAIDLDVLLDITARASSADVFDTLLQRISSTDVTLMLALLDNPDLSTAHLQEIAKIANAREVQQKLVQLNIQDIQSVFEALLEHQPSIDTDILVEMARNASVSKVFSQLLVHINAEDDLLPLALINNPQVPVESLISIAETSENFDVQLQLISTETERQEDIYQSLLDNHSSILPEALQLMAEKTGSIMILRNLLQRKNANDDVLLAIINNADMEDEGILSTIIASTTNTSLLQAISLKATIKSNLEIYDQLLERLFSIDPKLLTLAQSQYLAQKNISSLKEYLPPFESKFEMNFVHGLLYQLVNTIKLKLNQTITSNSFILWSTVNKKDKDDLIQDKLHKLNLALTYENAADVEKSFNQLCKIACTRRNAFSAFFYGKHSVHTKSAEFLFDEFKKNEALLSLLKIDHSQDPKTIQQSLKKKMLAACNNAPAVDLEPANDNVKNKTD
jgi:hypothetical protein